MKSRDERCAGWPLIIGIIVAVLALTAGPALAALTFSGTKISGDGAVVIDSSSTISIGTTATGITIGRSGQTVTFPGTVANANVINSLWYGTSTGVVVPLLLGTNLSITNSTLNASASGGASSTDAINYLAPLASSTSRTLTSKLNDTLSVKDFGAKCDGSTDDFAAFKAAITAVYNAGGGTVLIPAGTCVIDSQLNFPNSGGGIPQQPAIRVVGQGASQSGNWILNPNGGTQLDLRYAGGANAYKITTTGYGYLDFENITFLDTTDGTTDFLFTSNTTLLVRTNTFWGKTSAYSGTPAQDAIILGGRTTSTVFQGYTTHIEDNYFGNIRRAVYAQQFANGTVWTGNTVSPTSGGTAAFEIDGIAPSFDTGTYAVGNLVEMVNYVYGFKITNATGGYFANSFYDTSSNIIGGYYDMGSNAYYNSLIQVMNDPYAFATGTQALNNTLLCNAQQGNGCTTTFAQPVNFTSYPINFSAYGPTLNYSNGDSMGTQLSNSAYSWNWTPSGSPTETPLVINRNAAGNYVLNLHGSARNQIQSQYTDLELYTGPSNGSVWLGTSNKSCYINAGILRCDYGFNVGGASGLSVTKTIKGSDGNNCTITIAGGIITATTCP